MALTIKLSRGVILCDRIASGNSSSSNSRVDGTRTPRPLVTPTTPYRIGKGWGGWSGGRRMRSKR